MLVTYFSGLGGDIQSRLRIRGIIDRFGDVPTIIHPQRKIFVRSCGIILYCTLPSKRNKRKNKPMDLQPLTLLGGLTAADFWDSLNLVLVTWALLLFFPKWEWTPTLTLVAPLLHSLLYAGGIFSLLLFPEDKDAPAIDFTSLEGVVTAFTDPNVVFVGWVHYIVFDALVGRMIVLDSLQRNASYRFHIFAMIPSLLFCLLLGPVGFLLYMVLRTIFLSDDTTTTGTTIDNKKMKIL
jgi:hypothetical protein